MTWAAGNHSKCCGHCSDKAEKEVTVFEILKYSQGSLSKMNGSESFVLYLLDINRTWTFLNLNNCTKNKIANTNSMFFDQEVYFWKDILLHLYFRSHLQTQQHWSFSLTLCFGQKFYVIRRQVLLPTLCATSLTRWYLACVTLPIRFPP